MLHQDYAFKMNRKLLICELKSQMFFPYYFLCPFCASPEEKSARRSFLLSEFHISWCEEALVW